MTKVKLKKTKLSLYIKGTAKIKAKLENPSGKTTYKSSDKKIAKVGKDGKITALKKGNVTITVKNNGVSAKLKLTVKKPSLKKPPKSIKKGKSVTLKIIGKIGKAKFKSSNKKIAAVNKKGKVTGKKKGKVTITVTTNGIKIKLKLKVK